MLVWSFRRTEKSEKWLDALSDPLTSLYTFNSSIALSDLNGDGDSKLIVADLGTGTYQMKLKVTAGMFHQARTVTGNWLYEGLST